MYTIFGQRNTAKSWMDCLFYKQMFIISPISFEHDDNLKSVNCSQYGSKAEAWDLKKKKF